MLENIAILVRLWFLVYIQGNTHLIKRIKGNSKDVWTANTIYPNKLFRMLQNYEFVHIINY